MGTWKGGCLCGAVRYECLSAPLIMGFCHCRSCQQSTGAGHIAWMLVKKEDLNITGDFKEYHSKGGTGGNVYRGFCENCGSRLFFRGDSLDAFGAQSISATSLDNPSDRIRA